MKSLTSSRAETEEGRGIEANDATTGGLRPYFCKRSRGISTYNKMFHCVFGNFYRIFHGFSSISMNLFNLLPMIQIEGFPSNILVLVHINTGSS